MRSSQSISCKRIILLVADTLEGRRLCMNWLDCSHLLCPVLSCPFLFYLLPSSPLLSFTSILYAPLLPSFLSFFPTFLLSTSISSTFDTFPQFSSPFLTPIFFSPPLFPSSVSHKSFFLPFLSFHRPLIDSHLSLHPFKRSIVVSQLVSLFYLANRYIMSNNNIKTLLSISLKIVRSANE